MANTANNRQSSTGKAKSPAKAKGGKSAGKAVTKSTRGKSQQKPQQKAKAGKPAEKRGFMKFLRDVRIEMGKVTWPTRKDLAQSTLVVLVAVAIATAYTGVLDFVFSKAVDLVVNFLT